MERIIEASTTDVGEKKGKFLDLFKKYKLLQHNFLY